MSQVSFQPAGFSYIRTLHSLIGVSYFAYRQREPFKYVEVSITVLLCVCSFLLAFPCLFECTFDFNTIVSRDGYSLETVLPITVIYVDLYHSCTSCLLVAWRSGRLRYFFIRAEDYSALFKTDFTASQRQRLLIIAVKLVIYNVAHLMGETLLILLLVPHKVSRMNGGGNNSTSTLVPTVTVDPFAFKVLSTASKVLQAGQSKAVATILIFIMEYLSILIEKLEMRFDHFVYTNTSTRSVEVAKVAFIEMQSLIKCGNEIFSHLTYDVLVTELIIILLATLEVAVAIGARNLTGNVFHELYNLTISYLTLWLCCEYAGACLVTTCP